MIGREAIEPVELGGYLIPAGTTVFMPQWVIHRDGRWFDDPEAFRPERWADGLMQRIHRYAYFPFGGGPRICIGNNFALMEATLILATIARQYRLDARTRRQDRPSAHDHPPAGPWSQGRADEAVDPCHAVSRSTLQRLSPQIVVVNHVTKISL